MSGSYRNHDHGGTQNHGHGDPSWAYAGLIAAVGILLLLYGTGKFTVILGVNTALLVAIIAGYKIIYQAFLDLLNRKLSADLAIVIAAAAAIAVGEYFAAAEVMFIMLVGEGLEHYTVARAHRAIEGFVQMTPTVARVCRDGIEVEISPQEVHPGEVVMIRAGEKVPVDGTVILGRSSVDESMITGESMPAAKGPGDPLYCGSINEYGPLEARAEQVGNQTTLARVAQLITEAQKQRAPIETTADALAKYFLPAILLAGGTIYFFTGEALRAVAALIVACPCALVLATPAAVSASIARLAREGVLVKGGGVIESLARIRMLAFDKTGTLTEGRPRISALLPAHDIPEMELLALAAAAEQSSEHLLGREILAEARRRHLQISDASDFVVHPGMGVEARVDGAQVRVGNLALVRDVLGEDRTWVESSLASHSHSGQTAVVVVVGQKVLGIIGLRDPLRPGAAETVSRLKEMGVARICMVTGDEEVTARHIGRQAGIEEIYSRLLPDEKAQKILQLRGSGLRVLMVGDGINDSPALAVADAGLAMGRGLADISAEAAHVVFLRDRLEQIPDLLAFAQKTIRRIRSSIILFAFGVNLAAILGAAFGYLGPAVAAIVHQSASLFVILNCVRLLVEGKAIEPSPLTRLVQSWKERSQRLRHAIGFEVPNRLAELFIRNRKEVRNGAFWLLLGCWVLSGFTLISPEQSGVVQRFGRLVPAVLAPGIHYRMPWPMESITRVAPRRVRVVEIGYRTNLNPPLSRTEPQTYEWNTQHRLGRYQKVAEEGLMLTGDENLVEVNCVVQYDVRDPALYLFAVRDPEELIRTAAQQALRLSVAREPLDAILTDGRPRIEEAWRTELKRKLDECRTGLEILSVKLQDVHPPLEVVEAFRDVASALEEKSTRINEAEGYLREKVPLARGQSRGRILSAEGYASARIDKSHGDSDRFVAQELEYRRAPDVTALRLYLETIEKVLPNKSKFIVDTQKNGRRRFLFLDSKDLNLLSIVEPK
jgi:Cu+-exporting ATPase